MRLGLSRSSRGFTLIELLVVIAIIGMLSSIVLASLNSARSKARDARRIADLNSIATALELFYSQTGRYPMSPGHATWEGHWYYFSQCLETGVNCGFAISGYVPVMAQVPQDPNQPTPDNPNDGGVTYYPSYSGEGGFSCSQGGYRLLVYLENYHQALASDLDGTIYAPGGNQCADGPSGPYAYCIGDGTCPGW